MRSADHLLKSDHDEIDGLLQAALDAVAVCDIDRSLRSVDLVWARLAVHIRGEHLRLFPAILNAVDGRAGVSDVMQRLRRDHDFFMVELGSCVRELRGLSGGIEATEVLGRVATVLRVLLVRLKEHNDLEEKTVYPLVGELGRDDASRLSVAIAKELERMPARFAGP